MSDESSDSVLAIRGNDVERLHWSATGSPPLANIPEDRSLCVCWRRARRDSQPHLTGHWQRDVDSSPPGPPRICSTCQYHAQFVSFHYTNFRAACRSSDMVYDFDTGVLRRDLALRQTLERGDIPEAKSTPDSLALPVSGDYARAVAYWLPLMKAHSVQRRLEGGSSSSSAPSLWFPPPMKAHRRHSSSSSLSHAEDDTDGATFSRMGARSRRSTDSGDASAHSPPSFSKM